MRIEITSTPAYALAVDTEKNRAYLTIHGFWPNVAHAPNYLADWDIALKHLRPKFTLVADIRSMTTHPGQVIENLHAPAQRKVVGAGLLQTVDVVPESIIARAQVDRLAKTTAMPTEQFGSLEEAEIYLDALQAESV